MQLLVNIHDIFRKLGQGLMITFSYYGLYVAVRQHSRRAPGFPIETQFLTELAAHHRWLSLNSAGLLSVNHQGMQPQTPLCHFPAVIWT